MRWKMRECTIASMITERPGDMSTMSAAARSVGRALHGDADVGLLERRRVVDAGHAHRVLPHLEDVDDRELVLGHHLGEPVGVLDVRAVSAEEGCAELRAGETSGLTMLSCRPSMRRSPWRWRCGRRSDLDAERLGGGDGRGGVLARRIIQREEAEEGPRLVVGGDAGARDAERAQPRDA